MSIDKFTTLESTAVPLPIENVDTDQIIPARFLKATTREGFGENLFRDWRFDKKGEPIPQFVLNNPEYRGSILVAGKNFGCGSSREHAPVAIKGAGISCVIAKSFARIFFRNAFNMGLMIFESDSAADDIKEGDQVEIEPDKGLIRNLTTGGTFHVAPIPPFMQGLIKDGGLIAHLRKDGTLRVD